MSKLRTVCDAIRTTGLTPALHSLSYRAMNHVMYLKVLKVVKIDAVNPDFLEADGPFRYGFLDREQLLTFAADPRYDLSADFVREAAKKGDECYAVLDGDKLATYGWYSHEPTNIEDDLQFRFDRGYVYMYKGYTPPEYRGRRLHAVGMTQALQAYRSRGYKGLISYVESSNFASLKSCYRMGYQDVGTVVVARLFGHYFSRATKGCQPYGVRVEGTGHNPLPWSRDQIVEATV